MSRRFFRQSLSGPVTEPLWIEPLPDNLIELRPTVNPEAHYDAGDSVTLAFLATLQTLPGRHRAAVDKGGGAVHLVAPPISDLKTLCGIATSLLEAVQSGDMTACQGCWSPNVPLEIRKQLSSKYLRDPYASLI